MTITTRTSPFAAPRNGCVGWEDEQRIHHQCNTDDLPILAKGRCTRCYSRNNAAERKLRREAEQAEARDSLRPQARTTHPDDFPGEEPPPVQPAEDLRAAAVAIGANPTPPDRVEAAVRIYDDGGEPAKVLAALRSPAEVDGYAWTLFEQSPHVTRPTEPAISIGKDGDCRLNGPAMALWGEPTVEAVAVLYDRDRRALALRPCDRALAHARKLRPDKRARCLSLRGFRSAVALFGQGETIRATPRLVGDLLVVGLP